MKPDKAANANGMLASFIQRTVSNRSQLTAEKEVPTRNMLSSSALVSAQTISPGRGLVVPGQHTRKKNKFFEPLEVAQGSVAPPDSAGDQ